MKKLVMPNMGPYTAIICGAVNRVLTGDRIPVRLKTSPRTTRGAILRGWQLLDENVCLPAKINLGNYLDALDQERPDALCNWDTGRCGTCRFKVYHLLHESVLRRQGYDIPVYGVSMSPQGIRALREMGLPLRTVVRAVREAFREIEEHDTEHVFGPQARPGEGPRVGVLGELFTTLDPDANQGLLERLKKAGAQTHLSLPLTAFLYSHVWADRPFRERLGVALPYALLSPRRALSALRGLRRPDVDYKLLRRTRREAERYLPRYDVGGHGKESIVWSIYYALAGFDGVVHVAPFPCMPEHTVSAFLDQVSQDYGIPLVHLTFDAQFAEANLQTRVEALVNILRLRRRLREGDAKSLREALLPERVEGLFLGVDVGSVSTKAVVLNGGLEVVAEVYLPTARNPVRAVQLCLARIKRQFDGQGVRAAGVTGSGRHLAAAMLGTDLAADEISCQALGVLRYVPGARTIIEVGGQDSKLIQLDSRGVPVWYNMNTICSAGTGSFLAGASREFGIPIEEMGPTALACPEEVRIAGRCGVFAESDVVSKQQQGHSIPSLVRGLCFALPRNYLNNVARNRRLEGPVVFTGGVAGNAAVVEGFRRALGLEVVVPPHHATTGAIGAAMMAMAGGRRQSWELAATLEAQFVTKGVACRGCANECDVALLVRGDTVAAAFGSRCGKWEALVGQSADRSDRLTKVGVGPKADLTRM
jgi:predicted CoA-substrate-specific enzyme activase